ncbi:tetratricopeptide repeat protein [Pseudomonas sp. N040]|uniref:tetratricopeptide repeat protein n=1 Tax=Pseudomonas sp. N040 TaxID=2785325 RepID=UPI0018A2E4FA|nr:tetratricopeptide repeat protein [Pseudomonas sp. N040]MBF7730925.1 sel1 repeat family protein [Pseudomonas sp. N040]MBW7014568.1 sel1 repeat family protein [Pseudomonas sp. N040]
MNRTSRTLLTGCLLLLASLPVKAADNSLLVPITGSCMLNTPPEQLAEAVNACQRAAQAGDIEAQFELGVFHYNGEYKGELRQRDLSQALFWFEQASLKGHAQAQYYLGLMFYRGEGVPENPVQAYILLKMSAVNGAEEALDAADQVYQQMSRSQVEIANQVLGEIFRDYLLELQGLEQSTQPGFPAEPPLN